MTAFHTYTEIKTQPVAWQAALAQAAAGNLPAPESFGQVLFTGCGSTYYLAVAAAALYQELNRRPASAIPGGELLLNSQSVVADRNTLLVAISRSGLTSETLKAVEQFKTDQRGPVLVISNYATRLSELADFNIIVPQGQEQSMAQTRSFASMYIAGCVFAARTAGRNDLLAAMQKLPEVGYRLMTGYEALAQEIGGSQKYDRFYFLGSAIRYGLACEVNLKMKEMSLTHSEAFHFLEFRHGPMSMVNPNAVVVGLVSDKNAGHERAVLQEMGQLGGKILALAENEAEVAFESQIPESVRGVLYLPVLQYLAYYRALAKGLDPDRPKNLKAVIQLEL